MELTSDIMYQASLEKDSRFEGIFFMAVRTTGIFCRPTCTARKPRRENVEFFTSSADAMRHGYRPCKVCHPLEKQFETPAYVKTLLEELRQDPSQKLSDGDLVRRGIEPSKIRRWFVKHHGVTFHAYQRMLRLNQAFRKIQSGERVTATAFDTGYESLSGFTDSFKNIFGVSPVHSKSTQIIEIKRIDTPLGPMLAAALNEGICLLEFTDRKMLETELKFLSAKLNASILPGENAHLATLEAQLAEYFAGQRKDFTVPLVTPGTGFQNRVWEALQEIPYGEVKSYKEQAVAIGQPASVRAVANANGMNRIAILIPCHRVIGSDGSLTGYGGGIWRKKALLELEKTNAGNFAPKQTRVPELFPDAQ
jgi:AraC family transcriptional regulator, regulatory protein of adaptative response / methylated-DNA-[protein]-cysteine methyltransferase